MDSVHMMSHRRHALELKKIRFASTKIIDVRIFRNDLIFIRCNYIRVRRSLRSKDSTSEATALYERLDSKNQSNKKTEIGKIVTTNQSMHALSISNKNNQLAFEKLTRRARRMARRIPKKISPVSGNAAKSTDTVSSGPSSTKSSCPSTQNPNAEERVPLLMCETPGPCPPILPIADLFSGLRRNIHIFESAPPPTPALQVADTLIALLHGRMPLHPNPQPHGAQAAACILPFSAQCAASLQRRWVAAPGVDALYASAAVAQLELAAAAYRQPLLVQSAGSTRSHFLC